MGQISKDLDPRTMQLELHTLLQFYRRIQTCKLRSHFYSFPVASVCCASTVQHTPEIRLIMAVKLFVAIIFAIFVAAIVVVFATAAIGRTITGTATHYDPNGATVACGTTIHNT